MDRLLKFTRHADGRGALEVLDGLPFPAVRIFAVSSPDVFQWRGGHALRTCHQLLVPTKATLLVRLDDGVRERISVMPGEALYLPPMTWIDYAWGSPGGGSALVLASHQFDRKDYISDRKVFDAAVAANDAAERFAFDRRHGLNAIDRTRVSQELCGNG